MCASSVIHQYMQDHTLPHQWDAPMIRDYSEVMRKLDDLDRKLGQPDCVEPSKAAFLDGLLKRLEALEKKVGV